MNLELTQEQLLLKDSVERFVERDYSFEQRSAILASEEDHSHELWQHYAELGWLGAGLPETDGGFGGGPVEQNIICEALGRAMALEPFVSTAVIGAHALQQADDADLSAALLPELVGGNLKLALAYAEAGGRFDLHHVATRATQAGNQFTLSGAKLAAMDAPGADKLIVSARVSGETRDENGIALFLVDREQTNVAYKNYRTSDGSAASDLTFDDAPATLLVREGRGLQVLEAIIERGIAARCAQAAGAMDFSYQQTLEYVKTREQFGVAIGSFQVLQHRLVDMLIAVRECQAMSLMTAYDVTESDANARRAQVAGAKAYVGKRARKVAQDIVQLHGGVGMTEELSIGHFFRYLTQFCSMFGTSAHHIGRYVANNR
jgi:alkylation response protein AidB-like acyl-CoA dehydrogenase